MELSERDRKILNCVFNPNLPLEELTPQEPQVLRDDEESTPDVKKTKLLEVEAIRHAEQGDLVKGLEIINEAIKITPGRASLYNNRAHIYQYQRKFDDAMLDLTHAINLAEDKKLSKTLCQAHSQRGVLHKRNGNDEQAKKDFEIAADLGSLFAKNQLVTLNPYAALCNQMLLQVMENLKEPQKDINS